MARLLRRIRSLFRTQFSVKYAYPAMDIFLSDKRFHLVGSMHMGTQEMVPLPSPLLLHLNRASALIVEADISNVTSPFDIHATQSPLEQRLSAQNHNRLTRICSELSLNSDTLALLPGWQIALILQAQQARLLGLRPDYGIDHQLLQAAKKRNLPVIELEGVEAQLALLQALPDSGMSLLEDTLLHWHTHARLLQAMVSWWLETEPECLTALPEVFNSELNDTLIYQRNLRWRDALVLIPAGNYVVAVGAMHLYGKKNIVELLRNA